MSVVFPPEPDPLTERERVEDWRELELLRAGYPVDAAITIARSDADLHRAVQLLTKGCSVPMALEILL